MKTALIIILILMVLAPYAQSASSSHGGLGGSHSCVPVSAVAGALAAGDVCLNYQHPITVGRIGDVFTFAGEVTGPPPAAGQTYTGTLTTAANVGCTGISITTQDLSTAALFSTRFWGQATVSDTTCTFRIDVIASLSPAGAVMRWHKPITVFTNEPLTAGTLTVSDDTGGWDIHQDPICEETSPCFHEVNSTSTVEIMGNVSVNQTNVPAEKPPGFDGSLYVLLTVLALIIAHLGEQRRDNHYRIFAGLLLWLGCLTLWYEYSRLGFQNVSDSITMISALWAVQFGLGIYFVAPKTWEEKGNA